ASRIIQIFIDAKILVEAEGLSQVSHARTGVARCSAQNVNISSAVREHAADDAECGRFAGAVRADESEDFALLYFEADLIERLEIAVAFRKRTRFNDGLFGHYCPLRGE